MECVRPRRMQLCETLFTALTRTAFVWFWWLRARVIATRVRSIMRSAAYCGVLYPIGSLPRI